MSDGVDLGMAATQGSLPHTGWAQGQFRILKDLHTHRASSPASFAFKHVLRSYSIAFTIEVFVRISLNVVWDSAVWWQDWQVAPHPGSQETPRAEDTPILSAKPNCHRNIPLLT